MFTLFLNAGKLGIRKHGQVIKLSSDRHIGVSSAHGPSLVHLTMGRGFPLGGRHLSTAVSPSETFVSIGIRRKSSRSTEREFQYKDVKCSNLKNQ